MREKNIREAVRNEKKEAMCRAVPAVSKEAEQGGIWYKRVLYEARRKEEKR